MNDPTEEKSSRAGIIAAGVLGFILMYFLSFGPAVWIIKSDPSKADLVFRIYTPVTWLYYKVPQLKGPIRAYAEMWERL